MENKEQKEEKKGEEKETKKPIEPVKAEIAEAEQSDSVFKHIDMKIVSLFIIGFLVGLIIKTQATKTIVMGANDPQLEKTRGDYLLTEVGKEEEETEEAEEVEVEESGEEEAEEIDINEETASVEEEKIENAEEKQE